MTKHNFPSIEVLAADSRAGLPVVIGIPFRRGDVHEPASLLMTGPNGRACSLTARALNQWPDGSVRWALLTALAKESGQHKITMPKRRGKPADVPNPVRLKQSGTTANIDNGLVKIVLGTTGPGPIHEISGLGHRYLGDARALRFVVDDADTTHERSRTIEVLAESPLRVRVRIAGAHFRADGSRLLTYRLDVEVWAGLPTLRLDYQFFHVEPGKRNEEISIKRIGMDWDLNGSFAASTQRHFQQTHHTTLYVPREVFNPKPVALVTDETCGGAHVEDATMLLDDLEYPAHLRPPLIATGDWLGVGDGQHSVYLRMHDFAQMRPKRIRSDGANLALDIWPTQAGLLKLPQGRSRRQVMTITFGDKGWLNTQQVEQLLGAPIHEGRAIISPDWLRETGEFEMDRHLAPGAHVRFDKHLGRVVQLQTPQQMFDLGDTIDSGYCVTYPGIPNNSVLKRNAPALPRVFLAGPHSPFAPWAMPEMYEPIWTNNEYDGLWVLCTELMRTGRADLWNYARWLARHNIEVDFVHYHDDMQQNRATPQHSINHNHAGAIPSHFWTQGLLQYYCMTGDADVLEIAMALGDKIIEAFTHPELRKSFWSFSRELGWPMLALAHLVDLTGEPRFARMLDEIVEFCMNYQRPPGFDRMLVPSLWCWSCMFEGADLYQRRTGRKDIAAWLREFLESEGHELLQRHREGKSLNVVAPMVMAIGYERTRDKNFLLAGLACIEEFMDTKWWENPPPEIRPMAMTYRGLVRFLHHATKAGMLDHLEYASVRGLRKQARPGRGRKSRGR